MFQIEHIESNNANLIQLLVEVKLSLTDLNFCLKFINDFFSKFFFQRICLHFKLQNCFSANHNSRVVIFKPRLIF